MNALLQEDYRIKRRVTLVCAGINLLLAGLKLLLGTIGHSQALIADGVHSLSDLATDAMERRRRRGSKCDSHFDRRCFVRVT